ncbi:MAG: NAD(P)/FAD-dependent oxidoreductase [Myxococcales bacterium]|nr:NAD(P)/FAD-dependent oxidoreductase [Myxococcales bacterium]
MPREAPFDAIVVGSGPNGLAAAALLVRAGKRVLLREAHTEVGGGTRTAELTLPGFRHDVCSAVHPLGVLSPLFRQLPLAEHGLKWVSPPVCAAHPLPDGPAALLLPSLGETAELLGNDGPAYRRLLSPFLRTDPHGLLADMMGPLRLPKHPFLMARFGLRGVRPALGLARGWFEEPRARALFAGCAAHGIMPFNKLLTGAVGMLFLLTAHIEPWPVVAGGSQALALALASYIRANGGVIETGQPVTSLAELPDSRAVLFDLAPKQLVEIAGDALPQGYRRRLARYRYGPAFFKLNWALSEPIPWRDARCAEASTVHVGGTLEEVAAGELEMWRGGHPGSPFVMITQQSHFDPSRAPKGRHTGYAYCHVPNGSSVDMTEAIEARVERYAPGFRDCIMARHVQSPSDLERYNGAYVGGASTGGVADIFQFFTRPVARLNPYRTPNPRLFLCSAATPPGGGVHGMCGYHAARSAFPEASLGL